MLASIDLLIGDGVGVIVAAWATAQRLAPCFAGRDKIFLFFQAMGEIVGQTAVPGGGRSAPGGGHSSHRLAVAGGRAANRPGPPTEVPVYRLLLC